MAAAANSKAHPPSPHSAGCWSTRRRRRATIDAAMTLIGTRLGGRYEVIEEIGRGGMANVYRAHDPMLNREVAVKLIPPSMLSADADARFLTEARVVAGLDHPGIVKIFDIGQHEGARFFVMPIIEGAPLGRLIRDGSLRLREVLELGVAAAEALDYSHERGVVHRDVKPDNIMVHRAEDGSLRVVLMDFGLARAAKGATSITRSGVLVGTMTYVSPEQVSGQPATALSDIYALGNVLYECVVGEPPFRGELQSVLYRIACRVPTTPREAGAEIDSAVESLIMRCLEKQPDARPQRAREIAEALSAYRDRAEAGEDMEAIVQYTVTDVQTPLPHELDPIVGRAEEVTELRTRLDQSITGTCHLVLIGGAAGIGKTRLTEELESMARERGVQTLRGRMAERDGTFAYQCFADVIADGLRRTNSTRSIPDLSDLAPELIALFPMLGELPALRTQRTDSRRSSRPSSASRPPSSLEPGVRPRAPNTHSAVMELLARALARVIGTRPTLVVLEDLHRGLASIEALEYAVRRLGAAKLMFVGNYRTEETTRGGPIHRLLEAFRGDPRVHRLELGPLDASATGELIRVATGGGGVSAAVSEQIHEAAEGNPFFIKELVRSLVDGRQLAPDRDGRWALADDDALHSEALPATIQQVVEARLEYLEPERRNVLAVAAILGRSFEFDDLEAMLPEDVDVEAHLDRLVGDGLLAEERRSRGDRLRFTSAVVCDVLVAGLSRRKRRSLHRRFARRLEERHVGRRERVLGELVRHFSAGDVPDKTVEYAMRYARRSLDTFSADDALRATKTALEFLDDEWEGDPMTVGEAHELLARGHEMRGNIPGAMRAMEHAVDVFRAGGDERRLAEVIARAARMAWQARRPDPTRRWVHDGLTIAREAGHGDVERDLLGLAVTLANLRGDYAEAARHRAVLDRLVTPEADDADAPPLGGRLVVPLGNTVRASDPCNAVFLDELEVLMNVYETLLRSDGEGQVVPGLCTRWEAEAAGSIFRFELRPDVIAHDGTSVDSSAVKRGIERATRAGHLIPPAFLDLIGAQLHRGGEADHVEGVVIVDDRRFELRYDRPVPILPSLLTDGRAAIAIESTAADPPVPLAGTGAFAIKRFDESSIVLERAPDCGTRRPNIDVLEFRHGMSPHDVMSQFERGELSIAAELRPDDLETLLRDRRMQSRLAERPSKTVFFVAFNARRGPLQDPQLRSTLCDLINVRDVVWKNLGRFAEPASTFLPPGMIGHDASRRRRVITRDEARDRLADAGYGDGVVLGALLHPQLIRRYWSLAQAVMAEWQAIGVQVQDATPDPEDYLTMYPGDCDLVVGRYLPDYDDPDTFRTVAFGEDGHLANLISDEEINRLLEAGRVELDPDRRAQIYRTFDRLLTEESYVLPLFHGVDYRIAGPRVRGLELTGGSPQVDYAKVAIAEGGLAPTTAGRSKVLRVPMVGTIDSLNPIAHRSVEQSETLPAVFETLTRDNGKAHVENWLIEEFEADARRLRYKFRLRKDVRFHDGRRLNARDVRWSFERLLERSGARSAFAAVEGSEDLIAGRVSGLVGLRIHSPHEFSIQLTRPLAFLHALLANPGLSIVPEGTEVFEGTWSSGVVGTGPFRIVEFDPGHRLELERNPHYWRRDRPKCDRLVFHLGVGPRQILSDFKAGRFSLAGDLFAPDIAELRRSSEFGPGFRQSPCLSTTYLALDRRRPVFSDPEVRARVQRAIDPAAMAEDALEGLGTPARGIIPPGLSAHGPASHGVSRGQAPVAESKGELVPIEVAIHPVFRSRYPTYLGELTRRLRHAGFRLVPRSETLKEWQTAPGSVDAVLGRWVGDYADADAFARLIHSDGYTLAGFGDGLELDHLIDEACAEPDAERRALLYERVERTLREQAIVIALFHEQHYRFGRPGMRGLAISYSLPTVRYEDLELP
jgi:ABC-type transport system substrate-binding protein